MNLGQAAYTCVPLLSLSSITWYQSKGGDALKAGKVTVGLAMHWPCVTDFVVYPLTDSRHM